MRGGGAKECTKTASSSSRRSPWRPYRRMPVVPCASMPRASSSTASSSRSRPSEPSERSGHTIRRAPISPGPSVTVAIATGSCRSIEATTSPNSGNVARLIGSTRTSRMPPQVSPTAKASSSLTPYRCTTAWPDSMTSCASSYTAPSTQPPDTLPTTSPSPETAIAAPAGRGALRKVLTTVASPNVSSPSYHLPISRRTSRISDHPCQFFECGETVPRHKVINVRKRREHPARERFVSWLCLVRVRPHHLVREPAQPRHLLAEQRRVAALPAVGGDDDDRAARHPALPEPVEELLQ